MNILGANPTLAILIFSLAIIIVLHIFQDEIEKYGKRFDEHIEGRKKIARLKKEYDTPAQIVRRADRFQHTNYVWGFGDEIKENK